MKIFREIIWGDLADPPWRFEVWSGETAVKRRELSGTNVSASVHYQTMAPSELKALPVNDVAADDCALFMWATWPTLLEAIDLIETWGFKYKTCAFDWMKAHAGQVEMFRDDLMCLMGMGYWTRANSEPCLLATRGKPKRLNADVRQGIIAPRREHSRKPDGIHERIERLVAGPYLGIICAAETRRLDSLGKPNRQVPRASGTAMWKHKLYGIRSVSADLAKSREFYVSRPSNPIPTRLLAASQGPKTAIICPAKCQNRPPN